MSVGIDGAVGIGSDVTVGESEAGGIEVGSWELEFRSEVGVGGSELGVGVVEVEVRSSELEVGTVVVVGVEVEVRI